ncbi:MAG: hypothetical protein IJ803_09335, partial [Oribacterium sp.]|nr:hypothetical protein [Oribacterium sp.]
AYTVCQHFGIDSSDYSFGYIAGWSSGKNLEELKTSMNIIRKTASDIISSIENHLYRSKEQSMNLHNIQEQQTFEKTPEPSLERDLQKAHAHGRHH